MRIIRENKILVVAIAVGMILVAGSLLNYANDACSAKGFANKSGEAELGCFEFWLNRYQTLTGAVLALIAAWIATIPARGQLREMSRQSAASGRQSMLDLAFALEAESNLVRRISSANARIAGSLATYEEEEFEHIYQYWPDRWWEVRREMRELIAEFEVLANRYGEDEFNHATRGTILSALKEMQSAMLRLHTAFNQQTVGLDYENGEEDLTTAELRAAPRAVSTASFNVSLLADILRQELAESAHRAWMEVRLLEARAIRR